MGLSVVVLPALPFTTMLRFVGITLILVMPAEYQQEYRARKSLTDVNQCKPMSTVNNKKERLCGRSEG